MSGTEHVFKLVARRLTPRVNYVSQSKFRSRCNIAARFDFSYRNRAEKFRPVAGGGRGRGGGEEEGGREGKKEALGNSGRRNSAAPISELAPRP